ncbi:unnamed protein product [Spirodela intermedia]|uniref:Uncharacterized protein n=1 Tax=Spirodela intermedia TaxID=51605 RepID=A0A7I8LCR5_SPIIN|nr:unnamed protein product [Spirodela intermedia]
MSDMVDLVETIQLSDILWKAGVILVIFFP